MRERRDGRQTPALPHQSCDSFLSFYSRSHFLHLLDVLERSVPDIHCFVPFMAENKGEIVTEGKMCNLNGCSAICHGLGERQSLRSRRADVVHASLPEPTERSALVGGDRPSLTSAQKKPNAMSYSPAERDSNGRLYL